MEVLRYVLKVPQQYSGRVPHLDAILTSRHAEPRSTSRNPLYHPLW